MSWLYSQALVAEYLADTCSDGAPFAPSSGSPIPQAYLPPDKMTAFSRPSRFGMTFAPLTDDHGAALLTWFQAGFPARTSAQPAKAPASTASDPACGAKWGELSVKYDRASSSWKTHHCLWDEDLPESSLTLPKWGSMRDGVLSERMTSALPTAETDAGLWPTPTVPNGGRSMTQEMALNGGYTADGQKRQIGLENAVKYWPTPTVCGNNNRKGLSATSGDGLATAVKNWPTPTASLGTKGGRITPRKGREGGTLIEALSARKTWPTPTVNDSKNCTLPPSQIHHDNIPGALLRDGAKPGGQLNPTWVEWLMGWPLGWTDLKPLATARCRNARPPLGEYSASSIKPNRGHFT